MCPPLLSSWFKAEILDFGYPQNTESDTLKMYVTTEEIKYSAAAPVSQLDIGTDKV